ncbi:universal stress protein [Desulforhopalus singaporensis]|uniref:Nucleotide-binding universal stress protein, UspA family n=1 Tax=Desulforhopalus singaporensis TaxID=91360 RepID=A0A1H0L794_9BACT|nr:universal stress protein [Desulforhopalus singaporensis]SDO64129.1 Nucleotide-binding universal stress protein, UspA family [Desulforhopalus singaporensis]
MTADSRKTILAAMDTTATGRSVFKKALVLGSSMRAKVILVSVTPQYEGNMNRFFIKNAERQFSEPFRKILEEATDYATTLGLDVHTIHRMGHPSHEIVDVALKERANIILLGCAKRNQMARMLLGQTTAEITQNGPCDVLLVPEGAAIQFNKVLVGVNCSQTNAEAAKRAFEVAESYRSEVHGLYVIDIPPDRSLRYAVQKEAEQQARICLQSFCSQAEQKEIPVFTEITCDTPDKGLVNYARKKNINLIIVGAKSAPKMLDMFWEGVIESIASSCYCPVLVAKGNNSVASNGEFLSFFS